MKTIYRAMIGEEGQTLWSHEEPNEGTPAGGHCGAKTFDPALDPHEGWLAEAWSVFSAIHAEEIGRSALEAAKGAPH